MALEAIAVANAVCDPHALELAAATSVSVLITAESKKTRCELARWIHAHSLRRDGRFVVLRGAGATSARVTEAFARAGGGTLFVDALEQLRGWPQRRLLRLMEGDASGAAPGVGLQPAVRVVAGAGLSLWDEVVSHDISKRLFYRVNTIRIDAPLRRRPLR